jgi:hypothetical protein
MRREMAALVAEWKLLGGCELLPTVDERLQESYLLVPRARAVKALQKRKMQERRLAARAQSWPAVISGRMTAALNFVVYMTILI